MKITMYELIGLIKDNKAPKRIKWNYADLSDDKIYIWYDWVQGYYEEGHAGEYDYKLLAHRNEQYSKILNSTVKILPEESVEWEDIEELEQIISSKAIYDNYEDIGKDVYNIVETIDNLVISFNQLIKNQKYLKGKIENENL